MAESSGGDAHGARPRRSIRAPDDTGPLDGEEFDRRVFQPALIGAGINKVVMRHETTQVRAGSGVRTVDEVHRKVQRNLRWKNLRHTFASRLRMSGVELATIRDLLGHTTSRMTERYAHVTPGHLLEAVQRISRVRPTATSTATSERE